MTREAMVSTPPMGYPQPMAWHDPTEDLPNPSEAGSLAMAVLGIKANGLSLRRRLRALVTGELVVADPNERRDGDHQPLLSCVLEVLHQVLRPGGVIREWDYFESAPEVNNPEAIAGQQIIASLLALGADPSKINAHGEDALDMALPIADPALLDQIVAAWPEDRPLRMASRNLARHGPEESEDLEDSVEPVLHWMVPRSLSCVDWLIRHDYPVDRLDRHGESALFRATNPAVLTRLLDAGASRSTVSVTTGLRYPYSNPELSLLKTWNAHPSAPQKLLDPSPIEVDHLVAKILKGEMVTGDLETTLSSLNVQGHSMGTSGSMVYQMARHQLAWLHKKLSPEVLKWIHRHRRVPVSIDELPTLWHAHLLDEDRGLASLRGLELLGSQPEAPVRWQAILDGLWGPDGSIPSVVYGSDHHRFTDALYNAAREGPLDRFNSMPWHLELPSGEPLLWSLLRRASTDLLLHGKAHASLSRLSSLSTNRVDMLWALLRAQMTPEMLNHRQAYAALLPAAALWCQAGFATAATSCPFEPLLVQASQACEAIDRPKNDRRLWNILRKAAIQSPATAQLVSRVEQARLEAATPTSLPSVSSSRLRL